jgi:hypothetical protein
MEKHKLIGTKEKVTLLHWGFNIVIIEHDSGKQECLPCSALGLANRDRPNKRNLRNR